MRQDEELKPGVFIAKSSFCLQENHFPSSILRRWFIDMFALLGFSPASQPEGSGFDPLLCLFFLRLCGFDWGL